MANAHNYAQQQKHPRMNIETNMREAFKKIKIAKDADRKKAPLVGSILYFLEKGSGVRQVKIWNAHLTFKTYMECIAKGIM